VTLAKLNAARAAMDVLTAESLTVRQTSDFEEVKRLYAALGKDFFTPKMSPSNNDHTWNTAFWLFLMDDGLPIRSAACRLDDIGGERYTDYLRRTNRRHYPYDAPELDYLTHISPSLDALTGRLGYLGELYSREGKQGKPRIVEAFAQLMHVICLLEFRADFTYAFMPDRLVKRGFAARYLFFHQIPGSLKWRDPLPGNRNQNEYCVFSKASELETYFDAS